MSQTLSDRVRERLRAEAVKKKLSQREIADLLRWSQSRVAKLLTGRVEMGVDDLAGLCFALDLRLTEVVRDHGLEFLAEMTPTELRILERLRQIPQPVIDAVMTLLDVNKNTALQTRRAAPPKKGR